MIVDGTDVVFGRVATKVVKALLRGEEVVIVNAEKMVISGKSETAVSKFLKRRSLKHKGSPEKSPKFPKVPHLLVKRMIRGMLPHKKPHGMKAFKSLKVYMGMPEGLSEQPTSIEEKKKQSLKEYVTIEELCRHLGWG